MVLDMLQNYVVSRCIRLSSKFELLDSLIYTGGAIGHFLLAHAFEVIGKLTLY